MFRGYRRSRAGNDPHDSESDSERDEDDHASEGEVSQLCSCCLVLLKVVVFHNFAVSYMSNLREFSFTVAFRI